MFTPLAPPSRKQVTIHGTLFLHRYRLLMGQVVLCGVWWWVGADGGGSMSKGQGRGHWDFARTELGLNIIGSKVIGPNILRFKVIESIVHLD